MLSAGFEPAIPAVKGFETYGLDRANNGIGHSILVKLLINRFGMFDYK